MDGIRAWITTEGTGHWFFVAFPACLILLLFVLKGRRRVFLFPTMLITALIINPWFYKVWNNSAIYAYWRLLWIVPVIPVVAAVIPAITEKQDGYNQREWIKRTLTVFGVLIIAIGGTFLYKGPGGAFSKTALAAKLPEATIEIADRLLELKNNPRIVADPSVGVYIRQYTGEIDTLYGRNIYGFISGLNSSGIEAFNIMDDPEGNMESLAQLMLDENYDYMVTAEDNREMNSFELVDRIQGYGIYKAIGVPTCLREYDELGRIISETYLDEAGKPREGANGYSTVYWKYDDWNNVVYEFRVDSNGIGVEDENGCAGFEKEFDRSGHIITHRTLGADKKPSISTMGYAEVRREFDGDKLISEAYYDDSGCPIRQISGYASFSTVYDKNGNFISREYYDESQQSINRVEGYSKVEWILDDNGRTRNAIFYNTDGERVAIEGINLAMDIIVGPDGWSEWMTPTVGTSNCCFTIGRVNLGKKEAGDIYSCEIEVEFKGISGVNTESFRIWSQGAVDDGWNIRNIWDGSLLWLGKTPEDGIYNYRNTIAVDHNMAKASTFFLGFRCDGWKSGAFRVRSVKVYRVDEEGIIL